MENLSRVSKAKKKKKKKKKHEEIEFYNSNCQIEFLLPFTGCRKVLAKISGNIINDLFNVRE